MLDVCGRAVQIGGGNFGKSGRGMWLQGDNQLWVFYNEKSIRQRFILTRDHFRVTTQPILTLLLVFIGKWLVKNLVSTLSTNTRLKNGKVPPYNTRLESKEAWIPKAWINTLPQLLFSTTSKSLVPIQPTQASNPQFHQLNDSLWLEVSTLTSSTVWERGNYRIRMYPSFVQYKKKNPPILHTPHVDIL